MDGRVVVSFYKERININRSIVENLGYSRVLEIE